MKKLLEVWGTYTVKDNGVVKSKLQEWKRYQEKLKGWKDQGLNCLADEEFRSPSDLSQNVTEKLIENMIAFSKEPPDIISPSGEGGYSLEKQHSDSHIIIDVLEDGSIDVTIFSKNDKRFTMTNRYKFNIDDMI